MPKHSKKKKAQASSFFQKSFVDLIFSLSKISKTTNFLDLPKVSKMTYSESELDCTFAINSVSDFDSRSDSDSDSSSVFINLDSFIFFISYLHSSK